MRLRAQVTLNIDRWIKGQSEKDAKEDLEWMIDEWVKKLEEPTHFDRTLRTPRDVKDFEINCWEVEIEAEEEEPW